MNTFARTATALVAGTLIGAPLLTASPADAATRATSQFVVDTDPISLASTDGTMTATATTFVEEGHLQVELNGWIERRTDALNCLFAEVTFHYADGSTETTDPRTAYRACNSRVSYASAYRTSHRDQDVVQYDVSLRAAVDMESRGLAVRTTYQYVGDSPDSLGKAERLDRDSLRIARSGATLMTGQLDWAVARNNASFVSGQYRTLQGHLTGQLQWSDTMTGAKATAKVTWTYADGSTSTTNAATIQRGQSPRPIDVGSVPFKEALSAKVTIVSDTGATQGTSSISRFGDYVVPLR